MFPGMDTPFPDGGQLPSYTNPLLPASQQSAGVSDMNAMESYFTISSASQELSPHLSEVSSLPSVSSYQTTTPGHDVSTYTSMTSNPRHLLQDQTIWPSPPPGPEEFDNYSFQGSPSLPTGQSQNINLYNPSAASPRTWASSEQVFQAMRQRQQQEQVQTILRDCTPSSIDGFQSQSPLAQATLDYNFSQSFDSEPDGLPYGSPVDFHDLPTGTFPYAASPSEPPLETPILMPDMNFESPEGLLEAATPPSHVRAREAQEVTTGPRGEEPYAQLIYQAFMSRHDHCLTLQEIYQWFRDNTDKARSGTKGWQNSIRHNLSMNAAFVKRDKRVEEGEGEQLTLTGEPKRSTEWVLQDWAVRDGVQSTTRYRKGATIRRAAVASTRAMHNQHSYRHGYRRNEYSTPSRSASARRSGYVSAKAKLRGQHYPHTVPMSPNSHQRMIPPSSEFPHMIGQPRLLDIYRYGYPNRRQASPPQVMIKSEPNRGIYSPLTPEATTSDGFGGSLPEPSLAHPIHVQAFDTSCSSDSATYAAAVDQGHLYVGPSLGDFPYSTADVTGMYQPENHQQSVGGMGGSGSRIFETMPQPMSSEFVNWNQGGGI